MEQGILDSDKIRARQGAPWKSCPPNQRQVIELAYFEGLSQTEMAERMGQPLGTVKTWVRTALKKPARRARRTAVLGMNCAELRDHYELVRARAGRRAGERARSASI